MSRSSALSTQPSPLSPQPSVAIAGVSCRAAAESAARAGFRVTALDAFGDADQHPSVDARSMPRDFGARFTATAAARAAREVECDAVMYLSNFENHPKAVTSLAAGRELLGNPPSVLRRVRDPRIVTEALRKRGQHAPSVRFAPATRGTWLRKPVSSGGGRGVRFSRQGDRVPRGCYLQEFVEGTPGSVVFIAAGGRAVPVGLSRQIVGEQAFGARGFRYCGNILAPADDPQFARDRALVRAACGLARAAAEAFGLVGVNGVDFIACDGVPVAVEINPRWSASVELVELAYGLPVFAAHAAACQDGSLPDFDLSAARRRWPAIGKAIVFARREVTVGDTHRWWPVVSGQWSVTGPATDHRPPITDHRSPATDHWIRDVPHPGERIPAGRPVCTVFASGATAADCRAALVRRAAWVYAQLADWERNVA
jgi:predicted ATP-grasp superfamily ATP-dependent carboligase